MNLLDSVLVILKHRKKIFLNVFVFSLVALVVSLLIPKTFKASALIVPVSSDGGGISSLLGGYSLDIFANNPIPSEVFRIILSSQTLRDSLIARFNLFEIYGVEYKEEAYKYLDRNILVEVDKETGIGFSPIVGIRVSALDEQPDRSQAMANYCVSYLEDVVNNLNSSYIGKKYDFIAKRYQENRDSVYFAESQLRIFQNKNGVIELDGQIKAFIENLAKLEAEKNQLEIELEIISQTSSQQNSLYQSKLTQLRVIRSRIDLFVEGSEKGIPSQLMSHSVRAIPTVAMEYYQLYRNVLVKNKILEMMTIQYEQTRLQLDNKLPPLLVVDYASLPTYKFKPKRIFIVLAAFIVSLLLSIAYVFTYEFYQSEKQSGTQRYQQMSTILNTLKSDLRKLSFARKND